MEYDKLVRDRIPEIIRENGSTPTTHAASEDEYWTKLKEKLGEEVGEFISSPTEEEIADIYEVIDAILKFKGFEYDRIKKIQMEKSQKRGAFEKRIILERTE